MTPQTTTPRCGGEAASDCEERHHAEATGGGEKPNRGAI